MKKMKANDITAGAILMLVVLLLLVLAHERINYLFGLLKDTIEVHVR